MEGRSRYVQRGVDFVQSICLFYFRAFLVSECLRGDGPTLGLVHVTHCRIANIMIVLTCPKCQGVPGGSRDGRNISTSK